MFCIDLFFSFVSESFSNYCLTAGIPRTLSVLCSHLTSTVSAAAYISVLLIMCQFFRSILDLFPEYQFFISKCVLNIFTWISYWYPKFSISEVELMIFPSVEVYEIALQHSI